MALKPCRECKKQVSTQAATCPSCGVPNPVPPTPQAKPSAGMNGCILFLILIVVLGLFVTAITSFESFSDARRTANAARSDSIRFAAVASRPDTASPATMLAADRYFHENLEEHHSLHRAFIESQIDSVRKYEGVKSTDLVGLKRRAAIMANVDTAYTPGDLALVRRVRREMDAYVKAATARAMKERAAAQLEARKAYAVLLEAKLLDEGMDTNIRTLGRDHTTLQIKFILVSRAFAHRIMNMSDVASKLRGLGFKRVVFWDGYDERWTYDL